MLATSTSSLGAAETAFREMVVTNDLVLEKDADLHVRLIVRASHLTIDGNGATLVGPGTVGDTNSLAAAGEGVQIEGAVGVTLHNLKARGFAIGLAIRDSRAFAVRDCDFSDNYHNPKHGWGELPARGGILVERSGHGVIERCRANRVWDALHLIDSHDTLVQDNDFSRCSNTCAKLWNACRNRFLNNNLSHGIRIDRAAGEVHARDSTCVLLERGSDDNAWYRNNITHGGDGIFIRVLNGWVSRGNLFVENDTSYANNNCVESWSPGNTFIRNRANHGSYGFWMGGSDQTVLIGNEAAWNGLTNGYHQAPEPGFGHGGIVFVSGSSHHTLVEGNHCHDNNGGGIVFRGDVGSQGARWRAQHWIIQQNRLERNRWGIWGRWGDDIRIANNVSTDNAEADYLDDITRLEQPPFDAAASQPPILSLEAPWRTRVGEVVRFDASRSRDPVGRALQFDWRLGAEQTQGPVVEQRFDRPGFHRVGLTVHNGVLGALAWRDFIVADDGEEIGTEGQASGWTYELQGDDGRGRVTFADGSEAAVGRACLRFTPDPYPGQYATAIYRCPEAAGWDWSGRKTLRFWLRVRNPNIPGWQDAGPVIRLRGDNGEVTLKPAKGRNLLADSPDSEARWTWQRMALPLAGGEGWEGVKQGSFDYGAVKSVSLAFDSWDWQPFTVWLDGLNVE
ncbi:MAG: right-handed parallel beta-helix repeat-containing protein [Limisphaerales bacterium]